jgi:hypothetical protein
LVKAPRALRAGELQQRVGLARELAAEGCERSVDQVRGRFLLVAADEQLAELAGLLSGSGQDLRLGAREAAPIRVLLEQAPQRGPEER